jgi:hypothetical protein
MPSEPRGGEFVAVPGVVRPPELSHHEISAKGGRARTAAKLEAARRNLAKAKLVRDQLGAWPWHKAERLATVQAISRPCGPTGPT